MKPVLTVSQRAALLRGAHCEEARLRDRMEFLKDQVAIGVKGASERLTVCESELEILHTAIRALWLATEHE